MKASIVIPAYNSAERLYFNLTSLNYQNCCHDDFEVIVVDNGSMDNIDRLVSDFNASYCLKCIRLKENMGRAFARNAGAENAKGEILIFNDSDMINGADYVSSHLKEHQEENSIVCGYGWRRIYSYYYKGFSGYLRSSFLEQKRKYRLKGRDYLGKEMCRLIDEKDISSGKFINYSFFLEERQKVVKEVSARYGSQLEGYCFPWRFFMTNNCSMERELFLTEGGFDESFKSWGCEDVDLGYRLYKKGIRYKLAQGCISIHQEHPVDKQDDGLENIHYFIDKYNCIDLYLFYYGKYIIDSHEKINETVCEIYRMETEGRFKELLESFLYMMKILRHETPFSVKKEKPDWILCMEKQLDLLKKDQEVCNFIEAYNNLKAAVFK